VEQCERPELVTPRQIYELPPSLDTGDHHLDRPERLTWVEPPRSVVREARSGIGATEPFAAGLAKIGNPPNSDDAEDGYG
jgi:hypothetical protein